MCNFLIRISIKLKEGIGEAEKVKAGKKKKAFKYRCSLFSLKSIVKINVSECYQLEMPSLKIIARSCSLLIAWRTNSEIYFK